MVLALAAILFAAYVLDVVLGATSGASFLGDVGELSVLFAASVAFVAEIVRREAKARNTDQGK